MAFLHSLPWDVLAAAGTLVLCLGFSIPILFKLIDKHFKE